MVLWYEGLSFGIKEQSFEWNDWKFKGIGAILTLHQLKRSALSVPVGAFLEGSRKKTVAR